MCSGIFLGLLRPWFSAICSSLYYAFAIVWPSMVIVLYTDEADPMEGPWLSSVLGMSIVLGEIVGGFLAKKIGNIKMQCVASLVFGGIFFALVATCTPSTKGRASAFVAIGMFFLGWAESLSITTVTLTAVRQDELGTASGLAGSIRYLVAAIASTVFSVILTEELKKKVAPRVTAAITAAGLPASSVAGYLMALSNGTTAAYEAVPGINTAIIASGTDAYKLANASAYRVVFLSTIAWSVVGVIATLFLPDVDKLLTRQVATTLHKRNDEELVAS